MKVLSLVTWPLKNLRQRTLFRLARMAAKILQAGRRPRRRRVCISKRLTISITLAGITVSGFSLWPGYMSMKYDRQALDIAVWTARKEYLEYCDKLRSNDDESFGKECLEAQQLGLPPPPVATRRKQHPSYGSDLEALTPLATEADASRPTRTSNPTGVIEHTGSRSTKPSISAPHITSNGPVEPSSVAFVGYTSDSVYASYKEWPCQSGQTWTPVKAEVRCDSSIDADLSACVEGVIYEVNTATSSVSNLACWPSWTAATAAWDATRTVISQLSTTRMLGTQRQTDISDAGTTTSLPFVLPGLSIDSVSKPRYTVSSSE